MVKSTVLRRTMVVIITIAMLLSTAYAMTLSVEARPGPAAVAAKPSSTSIVDIVLEDDGEFDVLQAAVVSAGLVDLLDGNRQLTVFAPTDQAFIDSLGVADEAAAISTVESLDAQTLTNILAFHVTPGRQTSSSVLPRSSFQTLNGKKLTKQGLLDAGLVDTNISASNGVVHVIGGVLGL